MNFWDGTVGDGFSEGLWNGKAIPIMNELVQMARGPVPTIALASPVFPLPSPLFPALSPAMCFPDGTLLPRGKVGILSGDFGFDLRLPRFQKPQQPVSHFGHLIG